MTPLQSLPVELIINSAQLNLAIQEMIGLSAIALDTESNSRHHYPEQLCLIQIATHNKVQVIDAISLKELEPLRKVLTDDSVMKVVHGADYDIRCLDRHYGFRISNLYDTYTAARFAGIPQVGLAALLKDLLGVTITKSKQLQLADWGSRPLSREAIDYAATDVFYFLALQKIIEQRLQALGRTTWVSEECKRIEEVRYRPPDLETAYLSVKGAENLDGRGFAILRSLFLFREEEARYQHRPPFFVMPDAALISLSTTPTTALSAVTGLQRGVGSQRFQQGLQQALRDGLAAPLIQTPAVVSTGPLSPEQLHRLSRLKVWRASLGATLSLDPALVWPTASLERLAKAPDTFGVEVTSSNIRRWQRDQFASSLHGYLESNV